MAAHMAEPDTETLLRQLPRAVKMEELLNTLCGAAEFDRFRLSSAEEPGFQEINKSPCIMFPFRQPIDQTRHKISLSVQLPLGGGEYSGPDSGLRWQLAMDRSHVFERLQGLLRRVINFKAKERDLVGLKTALELERSVSAGAWEGRPAQLLQIPGIGPVSMRKLVTQGVWNISQLATKHHSEIERLLSRNPPFGKNILDHLGSFPRLAIDASVMGHSITSSSGKNRLKVQIKVTLRHLNPRPQANTFGTVPWTVFLAETTSGVLVAFGRQRLDKIDKLGGWNFQFAAELSGVNDQVLCHVSSQGHVGTIVSKSVNHNLPASAFPEEQAYRSQALVSSRTRRVTNQLYNMVGISDEELLKAAELTEARAPVSAAAGNCVAKLPRPDDDDYEFPLPTVVNYRPGAGRHPQQQPWPEQEFERGPVQLPNGKWQCNHACAGDGVTKQGLRCTHRCCKDGVDKPRKVKPRARKRRIHGGDVDKAPELAPSNPLINPSTTSDGIVPASKRRKYGDDQTPNIYQPRLSSTKSGPVKGTEANPDRGSWDHVLDPFTLDDNMSSNSLHPTALTLPGEGYDYDSLASQRPGAIPMSTAPTVPRTEVVADADIHMSPGGLTAFGLNQTLYDGDEYDNSFFQEAMVSVADRDDSHFLEAMASLPDEAMASLLDEAMASLPDEAMASVADEAMASVADEAMASVADRDDSHFLEAMASLPDEAMASLLDEAMASLPDEAMASVADWDSSHFLEAMASLPDVAAENASDLCVFAAP